jgi:hypothetical protein
VLPIRENLYVVIKKIKEKSAKRNENDYRLIFVYDRPSDCINAALRELCTENQITGLLLSRRHNQENARMGS